MNERHLGWQDLQAGDLFERVPVGRKYDQWSVFSEGKVPVIDQSADGVFGYHNDAPGIMASPVEPVVTFSNHRCYVRLHKEPFSVIQNVFPLRPREGVDPYFMFQALRRSVPITEYKGHWDDFHRMPVRLPPFVEQRAIAHILGALDDKIELSGRTSETLEAMTHALFRSWFVDFDPVRLKARGLDSGMSPAIADLFPAEFVASEIGAVPSGWEVSFLRRVAECVKGRSYKSEELVESDTALVTLKSFARGGGYRSDGLKPFVGSYKPEQVVEAGDVVVACTDVTQAAEVIGRSAIVRGSGRYRTLVASLDTLIVRPLNSVTTKAFLYCLGRTDAFVAHTYAHTTGTTVLHLSKEAVPSFAFAQPPAAIVQQFDALVSPSLAQIQTLADESDTIVALRATLLPKLISGELRVKDAERFVGQAV